MALFLRTSSLAWDNKWFAFRKIPTRNEIFLTWKKLHFNLTATDINLLFFLCFSSIKNVSWSFTLESHPFDNWFFIGSVDTIPCQFQSDLAFFQWFIAHSWPVTLSERINIRVNMIRDYLQVQNPNVSQRNSSSDQYMLQSTKKTSLQQYEAYLKKDLDCQKLKPK